MHKQFELSSKTRVFAENSDGTCFILTNNQTVSFSTLQINHKGCMINIEQETISTELPILVLTKHEYFGTVKTPIDIEKVKTYRQIG